MSESLPSSERSSDRRILIVVGPGRSGTSTMAGMLTMLGFEVPGKAIPPNHTNPRGFFEPRWVVNQHKRLLRRLFVSSLDPSPATMTLVAERAEREGLAPRVQEWLDARLEQQPRLVVKDPRLIWFTPLWASVAQNLGLRPAYVVMLRHPAEVIGSRRTYYSRTEASAGRAYQVAQLAGWVNVALETELATRAGDRALILYPALTTDWRAAARRIESSLHVSLAVPDEGTAHEVDDFIDPTLRRHQASWAEVEAPEQLTRIATDVWDLLNLIAEGDDSPRTRARLDELRADFAGVVDDAEAISRRAIKRARRQGRREGRRRARRNAPAVTASPQRQTATPALARRAAGRLLRAVRKG